jgi:hypothetical protein
MVEAVSNMGIGVLGWILRQEYSGVRAPSICPSISSVQKVNAGNAFVLLYAYRFSSKACQRA